MEQVIEVLLGISCVFLVGFLISAYNTMHRLKKLKKGIIENYGQVIDIDDVYTKMNSVSSYFENKIYNNIQVENSNVVDNITWNDLNMDCVFKNINNTQSTAGQEVLYDMLRRSIYDDKKLKDRDFIVDYFIDNPNERFKIQYILAKLGDSRELYNTNCLFSGEYDGKKNLIKYKILSIVPIISLLLIFINKFFILVTIASLGYNVYLSLDERKKNFSTEGFTYIIKVINTAKKIKSLKINQIDSYLKNIDDDLKKVKKIKNKSVGTDPNSLLSELNVISEYTNMLFLSELITYEKVKNTIIKNKEHLLNIYEYVGEIDALIAVASFRESLSCYSKPKLEKESKLNKIEFKEMYHPLITNPVTNDGIFDKSALITGSNASGKSTFIKAIAINSILAQSIYTCCAKEYNSSYFKIHTSMALKDDVLSNESYYIVEIKSLKRILDSIDNNIPCLCFVDEILRGTNTVERIASSSEVLSSLSQDNCLCFAATHDIELTYILEEKFDNYHFNETITDNDIKFDYKVHNGRAQSRNAIKLLGFMGYEEEIVNRAQDRAEKFVCTGQW